MLKRIINYFKPGYTLFLINDDRKEYTYYPIHIDGDDYTFDHPLENVTFYFMDKDKNILHQGYLKFQESNRGGTLGFRGV